jgi:predicted PurR-regulated permease PerM
MFALLLLTVIALPPELSIFLAGVASWLSNYLRDDKLPRQQNILIALVGFIVCVVATLWLTAGFTNDLKSNALLLITMGVQLGLGGKELIDLLNYIKDAPSPLVKPEMYINKESTPQREQVL